MHGHDEKNTFNFDIGFKNHEVCVRKLLTDEPRFTAEETLLSVANRNPVTNRDLIGIELKLKFNKRVRCELINFNN